VPFYLDSGALEPQRFDGPFLFWIAHLFPTYFGVGLMEHAFHDLSVTPESIPVLLVAMALFVAIPLLILRRVIER
jgi:hypothetical protein